MEIPVIFVTGQVGYILPTMLEHLVHEKQIAAFRRSNGWVHLSHDLIRSAQQPLRSGKRWDDVPLLPVL